MADATTGRRHEDDEQPTLLPVSDAHVRFLLSRETRERGLRHIAEIRKQLAEQRAAHADDNVHKLPPRHHDAA